MKSYDDQLAFIKMPVLHIISLIKLKKKKQENLNFLNKFIKCWTTYIFFSTI